MRALLFVLLAACAAPSEPALVINSNRSPAPLVIQPDPSRTIAVWVFDAGAPSPSNRVLINDDGTSCYQQLPNHGGATVCPGTTER